MRTESGERMMMIYVPEHKLLYGSDLVQQRRDGSFFMPEYLSELIDAVRREDLSLVLQGMAETIRRMNRSRYQMSSVWFHPSGM